MAFLWLSLREALKVLRKTLDVDKRNSKKQEQNRKNIVGVKLFGINVIYNGAIEFASQLSSITLVVHLVRSGEKVPLIFILN